MGVAIDRVDAASIKRGRTAFYAVDNIAFLDEQSGEIGPILSRYTSYQCSFCHELRPKYPFAGVKKDSHGSILQKAHYKLHYSARKSRNSYVRIVP